MQKVFVSHTPEDNEFANELVHELEEHQVTVLHDDHAILNWGDSLTKTLEAAIERPAYAILVLSRAFLSKLWSRRELDSLAILENKRLLLTIWHNISHEEVAKYSEALANSGGISAEQGIKMIAKHISDYLNPQPNLLAPTVSFESRSLGVLSVTNQHPADLKTLLIQNFSESELHDIYYHLDIDMPQGEYTKNSAIAHLVMRLQRRGELDKLRGMLKRLKPFVDWDAATVSYSNNM